MLIENNYYEINDKKIKKAFTKIHYRFFDLIFDT